MAISIFTYEFIYEILKIKNCIFDPNNYFSGIVSQNETWSTQKVAFNNYPQKNEKNQRGEVTGGQ